MNWPSPEFREWLARAPYYGRVVLCALFALWGLLLLQLPGTLYRWRYCMRMGLYCQRLQALAKASETRRLTPLELDEAERMFHAISERPKWLAHMPPVQPEVLGSFELWLQKQKAPTSALPRGGGSEEAGTQESGTRGN